MRLHIKLLFLLVFTGLLTTSVVHGQETYYPDKEWRTSTPEEQGLSSEKLEEMMTFTQQNYMQIDGVVLIRNGYLITRLHSGNQTLPVLSNQELHLSANRNSLGPRIHPRH